MSNPVSSSSVSSCQGLPAPTTLLKKTALNATHHALKAKMVDFGGWDIRSSIHAREAA